MTQQEHEAYVRQRWGKDLPREMSFGRFDIVDCSGEVNWPAARAFTEAREREIAELREEVDSAESDVRWFEKGEQIEDRIQEAVHKRILARLQRDLTALLKGWHEQDGGTK